MDAAHSDNTLAEPVDLSHHYTLTTRNRKQSNIKDFYKYFQIPGIQNVAGGMPNHNLFPYVTLGARVALPDRFEPTFNDPVGKPPASRGEGGTGSTKVSDIVVPHESGTGDLLREIDVKTALQYGTAQGYPPLYTLLRRFAREHLHPNVPYRDGPEILLTCGNTDGMFKAVEALATPWDEDTDPVSERQGMLCEEFAFGLALQAVRPRQLNIVPVGVDVEGMTAEGAGGLQDVLENWDFTRGKRPHIMYTVTVGQNPTTGTLSVSRRRALYAICVKYDVIIIEDDPYWYLQYQSAYKHEHMAGKQLAEDGIPGARNYNTPKSSGYAFLDSLVPSYLSVDYQGRVVRLDTFSKTVAPGCRLGWITTQPNLAERLLRITESSTQQPSGFVQSLIAQLLLGSNGTLATPGRSDGITRLSNPQSQPPWKMDGWIRWLEGLRGSYERRMNNMCTILDLGQWCVKSGRRPSLDGAEKSAADSWAVIAKTQMYSFAWPRGGMYVWLQVHIESHPLAGKIAAPKLVEALWQYLTTDPFKLLVSPGSFFGATPEVADQQAYRYFRLCFAALDEDAIGPASEGFVKGVRSFWMKKEIGDIEELLQKSERIGVMSIEDRAGLASLVGGC